jgi:hypothetical protein
MSRRIAIALAVMLPAVTVLPVLAHADDVVTPPATATPPLAEPTPALTPAAPAEPMTDDAAAANPNAPANVGDQAISAMIGVAGGGRTTPGGLIIAGHFFYQLSDQDWFDGAASFTFGSRDAECFRDRMDAVICDHGLADGYAGTFTAGVRRFLPHAASGNYWPFVSGGVGAGVVRFPPEDDTTGITFLAHAGVGLRASVAEAIAITGQAQFQLGLGQFSNGVGWEPQVGLNVTAGAEFKL